MKYVKIAVIAAFVLALGIFSVSEVKQWKSQDKTIPVITSDRDILEIPCGYSEEELLQGLKAYDEKDGDLTSEILVGSPSRFIEKGVCDITYTVFDRANQSAVLTRKIRFTDYHSPHFTLAEPLVFQKGEGKYGDLIGKIGARDQLDGNLKEWIVQTDTDLNYQKEGVYYVDLEVGNSMGDVALIKLPVHVLGEKRDKVRIELTENLVYVQKDETFDPHIFVEGVFDEQENPIDAEMARAECSADFTIPGIYEVHYVADDGLGNTGETWLVVVVEE